jgi:hypothetical protein
MREIWRRRAALSGAVVVAGILLAVSTLGCVGFHECTSTAISFFPGTETQRVVAILLVAFGSLGLAWAVRGFHRNGATRK